VDARDLVVGITASGRTPYVLGALDAARQRGAKTVGLATNCPCEIEAHCDVLIAPDVGAETIGGSTRMKSGTAQKLVLNMLSTVTMVRLGKTYGNLMVEVQPTNAKLRARARRLVQALTGLDEAGVRELLQRAGGDTKLAILMGRADLSAAEARARLDACGGRLREALDP